MDATEMKLVNESLTGTVVDDRTTIIIGEDMIVECKCPISVFTKHVEIMSDSTKVVRKLILKCTDKNNPCIGRPTNDGISFGRFEVPERTIEQIDVCNVMIECHANEGSPAFTLGSYGWRKVPNIAYYRNGSLACPETLGTRRMLDDIQSYSGSTKCTGAAHYYLEGEDISGLISDKRREYVNTVLKYHNVDESMLMDCGIVTLKCASESAAYLDQDKLMQIINFNSRRTSSVMMLRTCLLLDLPIEWSHNMEFKFEINKSDALIRRYFDDESIPEDAEFDTYRAQSIAMLCIYMVPNMEIPYDKKMEIMYEMIPTYNFQFTSGMSHEDTVKAYLNEGLLINDIYTVGSEEQYLKDEYRDTILKLDGTSMF